MRFDEKRDWGRSSFQISTQTQGVSTPSLLGLQPDVRLKLLKPKGCQSRFAMKGRASLKLVIDKEEYSFD